MRKIHIVCPFYRKHLLPTLIHYLEPMDIIWHPVCDDTDMQAFTDNDRDWIQPVRCPPLRIPGDQAFKKINDFIDTVPIIDDDYYGFMGDDDMYEPGFFDRIRQQTAKIIVFSLSRGDSVPNDGGAPHPTYPLIMNGLGDMFVFGIGFPQYIMTGDILRQNRFRNADPSDDGFFAENLKNTWPDEIKFIPDLFVWGNFFQPGRYTSKEALLKPSWELPEYK